MKGGGCRPPGRTEASRALHAPHLHRRNSASGSAGRITVRVRDGNRLVTDGPFTETKEVLGGYYIIECENLDDALEAAARCPGALYGSIEVRPIIGMAMPQAASSARAAG
jgi:hypothetical protein